ncbi:MAG: YgiT-type zinc finger protein [Candidatus Hatepunaea meridiana]|nr:YgiT-type zinc finger protein [Candidatus Hatepunaea meridiana]
MKCVICHSEEIEIKAVNEEITIGTDIVYVPIKVPVCIHCGERYYNRRMVQFLENTKAKLTNRQDELKQIGKVFTFTSLSN